MLKPSVCFVSMPIYHLLADSASSRFCGGAELQQLMIARELATRGYRVTFVTRDHGQGPEQQLGPFRVLGAYRPEVGLPALKFYHPRWGCVRDALRKADADIYTMRGAGFLLAPIVRHAQRAGKRVVFAGAANTDFDARPDNIRFLRDRILYWWGLRRVDAVVAQNQYQAGRARERLGLKAPVIHNALPDAPAGRSSAEDVLWVGNIRPIKQPERFVDLAAAFPGHPFVMVGGIAEAARYPAGPTTSTGNPASAIPHLDYTGYLTPAEVEHNYGRARVLVNTSDVEGFPNTFLHAWAWGVPVLTFVDPDGIVAKNKLGWVVSSPDEMQRVLGEILNGERQGSAEHITAYYRAKCMTPRQVDLYEKVFAGLTAS